ncbi:P-loop containing nucleoside triphosphate hydrolase protein [Rostrohypoxylon terebratum]|nr:P-loop containing nucleoside triphosphate hydrolase protein [Rostrohypoxylon terebratum]
MPESLTNRPPFSPENGEDFSLPNFLLSPNSPLPLDKTRVEILMDHLHTIGYGSIRVQELYGQETSEDIDWQDTPHYPGKDTPKSPSDIGLVVRKVSRGPQSPWKIHSIIVRSPQVMSILQATLEGYPGISLALDELTLISPFRPILHRWGKFCQEINSTDSLIKDHTSGFTKIVEEELAPYRKILSEANDHGVIEHGNLWIIFVPGEFVWWMLKQNHCIGKVIETQTDSNSNFVIKYEQKVWNGFSLENEVGILCISPFTGTRPITELTAIPLLRKPDVEDVRVEALERGKKFLGLTGCHYREYLGLGKEKSIHKFPPQPPRWTGVSGRVILDAALWDGKVGTRQRVEGVDISAFNDSEIILCSPLLKGYSFADKKWYELFVSNVIDITWDNSFIHLELDQMEKDLLIQSTRTKLGQTNDFDDMVSGKGKGVIVLLSGPPGVGKTLTAESIADEMRVPLYPLSAGELGIDPVMVEQNLRRALTFSQEWNAVLLLDEADIFLEKRGGSNIHRNQLVSVFLRLLEYFQGMMFLTTNRVESIDPAFESRIDLTIQYPELSETSRLNIWKTFIGKEPNFSGEGESKLAQLSSRELNGRQIKSVIKLARMLATHRNQAIDLSHLESIIARHEKRSQAG